MRGRHGDLIPLAAGILLELIGGPMTRDQLTVALDAESRSHVGRALSGLFRAGDVVQSGTETWSAEGPWALP